MRIYQIDPTSDERWPKLLERHPKASVFHTAGWLKALRRTYGYEPLVFTTSSPTGELENELLFCRIESWLTGIAWYRYRFRIIANLFAIQKMT